MIRPGRAVITDTLSARSSASSMSCVTNSTVCWWRSHTESSSSCITERVWASRLPNGSSISSTSGSMTSTRAMPTRCFIPPESSAG